MCNLHGAFLRKLRPCYVVAMWSPCGRRVVAVWLMCTQCSPYIQKFKTNTKIDPIATTRPSFCIILRADSEKHTFNVNLWNRLISASTFVEIDFDRHRLWSTSPFNGIDLNRDRLSSNLILMPIDSHRYRLSLVSAFIGIAPNKNRLSSGLAFIRFASDRDRNS